MAVSGGGDVYRNNVPIILNHSGLQEQTIPGSDNYSDGDLFNCHGKSCCVRDTMHFFSKGSTCQTGDIMETLHKGNSVF